MLLSGVHSVSLVVAAGPDLGRKIDLEPHQTITVGRGQAADLQLSDAAVSRHHLTLRAIGDELTETAVVIAEIPGANPVWTLVEGKRTVVAPGFRLLAGVSITLGNTTLQFAATPRGTSIGDSSTVELDASLARGTIPSPRLAALAAVGERLARCESLQAVYREACSWAIGALEVTRALLLSPDGTDILSAAAEGAIADLAISRTLMRRVLSERRAFLVRDILSDPDLADKRSVTVRGIAGAMAAPAANLVFYVEWGTAQAASHRYDQEALLLLVCAAQLISASGDNATERSQLRAASKIGAGRSSTGPRLIGNSAAMSRLLVFIERVAPTSATVLLHGESGTGKELVAAMIHAMSDVASGPFVAINCAAIPEQLLESELFGHEKGAFTGAVARHDGVFSRADTGTLFLDEIGEMSPSAQARMLRVLETRSFTRVGGTHEIQVRVRLIAATHRNLDAMVEAGTFRQDLLYRLSVIRTELPPLRERREDVEALVWHFVAQIGDQMGRRIDRIADDALDALRRYHWPGNVRELRNVVERAIVLGDGGVLRCDDLPP
jgi:DNA-binding NtrC family response regulator